VTQIDPNYYKAESMQPVHEQAARVGMAAMPAGEP
jgi:hypothetical protein